MWEIYLIYRSACYREAWFLLKHRILEEQQSHMLSLATCMQINLADVISPPQKASSTLIGPWRNGHVHFFLLKKWIGAGREVFEDVGRSHLACWMPDPCQSWRSQLCKNLNPFPTWRDSGIRNRRTQIVQTFTGDHVVYLCNTHRE